MWQLSLAKNIDMAASPCGVQLPQKYSPKCSMLLKGPAVQRPKKDQGESKKIQNLDWDMPYIGSTYGRLGFCFYSIKLEIDVLAPPI